LEWKQAIVGLSVSTLVIVNLTSNEKPATVMPGVPVVVIVGGGFGGPAGRRLTVAPVKGILIERSWAHRRRIGRRNSGHGSKQAQMRLLAN
jgi:hypothetical protein